MSSAATQNQPEATGFAALGPEVEQSRAYCEQLTRAKARNFYYGMKLLPEPKRSAMFAKAGQSSCEVSGSWPSNTA